MPIIQAAEDAVVYVISLWVERRIARRGGPVGVVVTTAVTLYGAFRFNDEYVLLPHNTGGDVAVIVASVAFVAVGAGLAGFLLWRDRGRAHDEVTDPWRSPSAPADTDGQGRGAPDRRRGAPSGPSPMPEDNDGGSVGAMSEDD